MQTETKISRLEKIIETAKKNGADSVEVIQRTRTENPVSFENNKLKSLESNESSGISVRLIKNKKIGMSASTDPEALESIALSAIESSEFGPEATFEFTREKLNDGNRDVVNHISTELPLENLVERGIKVIDQLKPFHKDLLVSGGFDLSTIETIYLNSNGVHGKKSKSVYGTSFSIFLAQDEDFLGIYEGNKDLANFPSEKEIADKVFNKLELSKNITSLETKKYTVIFTPHAVASIFAEILGVILNGKVVQQKISPLTDKIGKELFDKKLSFTENPAMGVKASPFDDEGIKTTEKALIKNGVVNSFYFDLSCGSKVIPQHDSTGNGFKGSLAQTPSPGLTSLTIDSGKTNHIDLIKNTKEGILIDQVLGAGQSNTLAGEFSVGIDLGFKIENGKIKGRIKNCMIAGNIFEVLKNITDISKEQEWIYGSMLFPYFLIDGMTVAGK